MDVILNAVLGGLWRRWHGMGQGPRAARLIAAVLLCWPAWFALEWYWAAPLTAAVVMYWVPGHDWTNWKKLLVRYGPTPVALGYIWANWAHKNDPQTFRRGGLIDGPFAIAELWGGAWVFGSLGLLHSL